MTDLALTDAPEDLKEAVNECVQWSNLNIIVTQDDALTTAQHLQSIKAQRKVADEFFDPPIKQAHDLHKLLVSRKKLVTGPLDTSEAIDKKKMLIFQSEQERIRLEEQRRLQAIADAKAQAERQKAEQEAAEQRRVEQEARDKAERLRKEAAEASDAERKRLLAQAATAERKAEAANIKAESKAEAATAVIAPVVMVAKAEAAAGISTRRVWKARVVDAAIVPDTYKLIDERALDKIAKALKEKASVPGVTFYYEEQLASRAS